jgi:hypothetical protein
MVETREKPEFGRFFLQSPCFSAIFWAAPAMRRPPPLPQRPLRPQKREAVREAPEVSGVFVELFMTI